jgi:hypothetical protein
MAEEREMRPLMARCYVNLDQLNLRRGKMDEGRRHLTSATTMFREMDMPFWLARAEAALSERDDTH